ncbi:MAG: glycosyltransferase family 2 protein, partial [Prevotellaceae bacterium]|nr:glycosyltransferase family 2 protein [Prevotellaceae bacterium]
MKVTVLVAAYNTEKYLPTCLDSLLTQTHQDWQALCIDDGSTDGTWEIMREYAERDPRFVPLHMAQNIGKARAMNQGLMMAKGDYICFLDSDDWFSPDALEKAVATFEQHPQTGCVLFKCRYVDEKTRKMWDYGMPSFDMKSGNEAFLDSLTWKIHGIYMTRTSIQLRYPYDESAKGYSEDNTTRIHYFVSREVRLCDGVYFYLQRKSSITHNGGAEKVNYLTANEVMAKTLVR